MIKKNLGIPSILVYHERGDKTTVEIRMKIKRKKNEDTFTFEAPFSMKT